MNYDIDEFGNVELDSDSIFELFARGEYDLSPFSIKEDDQIKQYNDQCRRHGKTEFLIDITRKASKTLEQRAQTWNIPDEYRALDILSICIERCSSDEERDRVELEMKLFEERKLVPLLQALVYTVDVLRNRKILWGVGRGSSVASYVLFLIGIHRIDSIRYGLDIREFLR